MYEEPFVFPHVIFICLFIIANKIIVGYSVNWENVVVYIYVLSWLSTFMIYMMQK